jgi:hypothetical protein
LYLFIYIRASANNKQASALQTTAAGDTRRRKTCVVKRERDGIQSTWNRCQEWSTDWKREEMENLLELLSRLDPHYLLMGTINVQQ